MQIDFYEEYPTEENLEKLRFLKHPTKLFVAAHSLEEFQELEKKVKRIKKDAIVGYWPILNKSDGYWISPFSNPSALGKCFEELNSIKNPLLIDLELPLKKKLFMKNLKYFSKNKKLIKQFLEKNQKRITTAEFPVLSFFKKTIGLNYDIKTEKSLMWYSSMIPAIVNSHIKRKLFRIKDKTNYSVSLGTIATGVLGNEPILPPDELKKDLNFVKNAGFDKVIIFRLGGLNQKYINIINHFQDK